MKNIIILILILVVFCFVESSARPQYSIIQTFGTKCSVCHVNTQGGGLRNNSGWLSRKDISLVKPSKIGLGKAFDALDNNTFFSDILTFGLDFRYQSARWPRTVASTPPKMITRREWMVMQCTPAILIKPLKWLEFEGFYNLAYEIEKDKRYTGQNSYAASVYFRPAEYLPALRAGYFQPTIGTKYDDHTMLIKTAINSRDRRTPVVPDDYAELGAQVDYESIKWLGLSAGVFDSKNLSKLTARDRHGNTIPIVEEKSVSTVLRGVVYPEAFKSINAFLGGTILINGDYYISSLFVNSGLSDKFSLMTEYTRSEKKNSRLTLNFLAELTYQLHESVLPFVRAERAVTKDKVENHPFYANQFVFGAHINPLPFFDFLPEYRIYNSEQISGYSAEWTLQLHVFY